MALPFFDHGAARVAALVRPGMLCAFDFDGTLAPIVADPAMAAMPDNVLRRLLMLQRHAQVAIITGRALADITLRLDFRPDHLIGNHGIEGWADWERWSGGYQRLCAHWHARLIVALRDTRHFDPAIVIEDKTLSLSVHYRRVRERRNTEIALRALFAGLLPEAHVVTGKCVFNLLPPDAPDKGDALAGLCARYALPSAIYVGDDDTDEAIFRRHRADWLTLRIQDAAGSGAEFFVPHQRDLLRVLDTLLTHLAGQEPIRHGAES
ncbi:trehalose-phosphatase [Actimicrobium antarcticum]|uniref:Trehalose 6-phosphate phosphatase n=1 Tax=Actimicrobium antarcticum TaxID=1051899 RepID=A0ABP7TG58_9BURK